MEMRSLVNGGLVKMWKLNTASMKAVMIGTALLGTALLGTVLVGTAQTGVAQAAQPAAAPPKVTPELLAKGKVAYTTNCVVCHGDKGDGKGVAGAAMNPAPRDLTVTDLKVGKHYKQGGKAEEMFKTVTTGLPGTAMVGYASIPEQDRWALVYYIQNSLRTGKK